MGGATVALRGARARPQREWRSSAVSHQALPELPESPQDGSNALRSARQRIARFRFGFQSPRRSKGGHAPSGPPTRGRCSSPTGGARPMCCCRSPTCSPCPAWRISISPCRTTGSWPGRLIWLMDLVDTNLVSELRKVRSGKALQPVPLCDHPSRTGAGGAAGRKAGPNPGSPAAPLAPASRGAGRCGAHPGGGCRRSPAERCTAWSRTPSRFVMA